MVKLVARLAWTVALLVVMSTKPAAAADTLSGVVLDVLSQGQVVVRHDPGCGMPAMTMRFRIEPRYVAAGLRRGDHIYADADLRAYPAVLHRLKVIGHETGAPAAVHNVAALVVGDAMPDTTFFDEHGQGFTFQDFRNETVVLSFVYTRCRDPRMCPLISANFHALQTRLAGLPVHLVEITLDPAYDTPPVLARYGAQLGEDPARWTFGTGPVDVVNDFAARFGIAVFADPSLGLVHSDRTVLIDRSGAITDLIDEAAWNPDDVAARVRELSAVPSNPIAYLDYELSKAAVAICGNSLPGASGLLDLFVVMAIFSSVCVILWVLARKIFIEDI